MTLGGSYKVIVIAGGKKMGEQRAFNPAKIESNFLEQTKKLLDRWGCRCNS